MKKIELTIKALSPLAIGRQKPGGSVSEVENYIPGSVIRGAIASCILQQTRHQNSNLSENGGDFQSLFLGDSPAIFHNGYPAIAKSEGKSEAVTDEVKFLPATAVSSKTNPGFNHKGNGVFDTLIDRFCAEVYNYPYDPNCPNDGGRVEPFSGFYSQNGNNYRSHSVSTRFLTRVGINRSRATAEDDILYSIEVLNESFLKNIKSITQEWENVTYRSAIWVADDTLATKLTRFINDNRRNIRLGGSTSRGLGQIEIEAKEINPVSGVKERIDKFNKKLKDRWDEWAIFGEPESNFLENRTYFTIDLQSDTILTEQWRYTTIISPEMLCHFAGLSSEFSSFNNSQREGFLKLHVAYSTYDYRSGWNAAWGLMKDVELVTNKGAVYLYSTTQPNIWIEKLKDLEAKGVGDRTCEGLGQIQVCNDFHCVFRKKDI